ncbi:hypothetical protein N4679_23180, partial [Escherichia coli]|nr:hypothetical protein [Escherichia coli]
GTVCVVGKMRDMILQLSKSSIYSTKPSNGQIETHLRGNTVSPFKKAILVILQVACAATLII